MDDVGREHLGPGRAPTDVDSVFQLRDSRETLQFLVNSGPTIAMDELEKAGTIAAAPEVRRAALPRFNKQTAAWGVAIPDIEPLVLDFGLGQFETVGLIESWIANETVAGYCGKYLFVSDGQTCPTHHHKHKHETFFVVEGRVTVKLADDTVDLVKGDRLTVPALTKHCFTGVGPALLLELSQPCLIDDNYFEDTRIPIGGNYQTPGPDPSEPSGNPENDEM